MNWLLHQFSIVGLTMRLLAGQPVASLLNVLVIGIALALPVGFYVVVDNLDKFSRHISNEPQFSVFMALDASASDSESVEHRLKAMEGIKRHEFVPRAAALDNLKHSSGLKDVLENLHGNPLPDSFIVVAESGDPDTLESLRDSVLKWPGVAHVQLDSDWARRLDAALGLGRTVTRLLAVLLAAGLVAVTFNTIRLQILTRHEEIEVSRLIGATDSFIRRPFLYFGAIQGLFGGVAAGLIVLVSVGLLNHALARLGTAYGAEFQVDPLPVMDLVSLLVFSGVLGWLGAWMSVSRHLWNSQPQ